MLMKVEVVPFQYRVDGKPVNSKTWFNAVIDTIAEKKYKNVYGAKRRAQDLIVDATKRKFISVKMWKCGSNNVPEKVALEIMKLVENLEPEEK